MSMNIKENLILEKEHVGTTPAGDPIIMIVTYGGLFAFFAKINNKIETLGMAPHKGIAAWMAEKRLNGLKWNDNFMKHEDSGFEELKKHQTSRFNKLKKILFSPINLLTKNKKNKYFILYNVEKQDIQILHKNQIKEDIKKKVIDPKDYIVRPLNLSESYQSLLFYKDFK